MNVQTTSLLFNWDLLTLIDICSYIAITGIQIVISEMFVKS